jgi:hypothetical protein
MAKRLFPDSKNYQKFWGGKINEKEQLLFWAQIQISNGFKLQIQKATNI